MTLETLITLLTIENNIIKNYFVTYELSVTGTTFSILEMFSKKKALKEYSKVLTDNDVMLRHGRGSDGGLLRQAKSPPP